MKKEEKKAQGTAPAEMSEREARISKMIDDFRAEAEALGVAAEALGVAAEAFINDRESQRHPVTTYNLQRLDLLMLLDRMHPTVEDAEALRGIAEMILQKRRADAAKAAEPAEE